MHVAFTKLAELISGNICFPDEVEKKPANQVYKHHKGEVENVAFSISKLIYLSYLFANPGKLTLCDIPKATFPLIGLWGLNCIGQEIKEIFFRDTRRLLLGLQEASQIEVELETQLSEVTSSVKNEKMIFRCLSHHFEVFKFTSDKPSTNWSITLLSHYLSDIKRISSIVNENLSLQCNTLIIKENSDDYSHPSQLANGLEAGLNYLTEEMKASHVIIHNWSWNSSIADAAIMSANLKPDESTQYCVISETAVGSLVEFLAPEMVYTHLLKSTIDIDSLESAQKLSSRGIWQIIVQHKAVESQGNDGKIDDTQSLARVLQINELNSLEKKKIILTSHEIQHLQPLPVPVQDFLREKKGLFLQNQSLDNDSFI